MTIRRFLKDDPEVLALFELAIARGPGNPTGNNQYKADSGNNDNVIHSTPQAEPSQGNSKEYALRCLAEKRPDLLEEVTAGNLSAHRAMVQVCLKTNYQLSSGDTFARFDGP